MIELKLNVEQINLLIFALENAPLQMIKSLPLRDLIVNTSNEQINPKGSE